MKIFINCLILIFVLTLTGKAQNPQLIKKVEETLLISEIVVKDAPFSADVISENVQNLPDGNKIKNTFNSKMYRDSEGRFRREGTINPGMILTPIFKIQPVFHIVNPVEGVRYYLDTANKMVREMRMKTIDSPNGNKAIEVPSLPPKMPGVKDKTSKLEEKKAKIQEEEWKVEEKKWKVQEEKWKVEEKMAKVKEEAKSKSNLKEVVIESDYVKTETLGTKQIEGVEVVGNRTIHGINAGSIGNEKPIEIVYERWYSKELQLIVFSKYYDPRFGEQTYRLTNISRNNPDKSLFELPKDYKIVRQKGIVEIPKRPSRPPIEKRP